MAKKKSKSGKLDRIVVVLSVPHRKVLSVVKSLKKTALKALGKKSRRSKK